MAIDIISFAISAAESFLAKALAELIIFCFSSGLPKILSISDKSTPPTRFFSSMTEQAQDLAYEQALFFWSWEVGSGMGIIIEGLAHKAISKIVEPAREIMISAKPAAMRKVKTLR